MTIPCGTATDPPLCGACTKPASKTCAGYHNMKHCSQACQMSDWKLHKTLCSQFKDFQDEHRPSPKHRRIIYFPHDENRPRFVWLKYQGSPKCMSHDLDDFRKYIPQMAAPISHFDSYRELGRQWNTTFWIQQQDVSVYEPINRSLVPLLGAYAARWRGPIICMAPIKYAFDTDGTTTTKTTRIMIVLTYLSLTISTPLLWPCMLPVSDSDRSTSTLAGSTASRPRALEMGSTRSSRLVFSCSKMQGSSEQPGSRLRLSSARWKRAICELEPSRRSGLTSGSDNENGTNGVI